MSKPSQRQLSRILKTWKTPMVPNFIIGIKSGASCPIAHFSSAELREIARRWTANLVALANKRRKEIE